MKSIAKIIIGLALTGLLGACSGQKLPTATVVSTKVKPTITVKARTSNTVKPQAQADRKIVYNPPTKLHGKWTVEDILQTYGASVKVKLSYYFAKAKVSYPPREIIFIALKQEKKLELWARDSGEFRFIRDYYILTASGATGPKLRRGDRQVPEGIYRIMRLNPNSPYHLSMKLDYPNTFDLFHARQERRDPGSNILIHGKAVTIGCLPMGDESIEELFVLTAQIGAENVKVVIAPHDPRTYPLEAYSKKLPKWTAELYSIISREIKALSPLVKSTKTGL